MAKLVVGLFNDVARARAAAQDLDESGFTRDDIEILSAHEQGDFVRDRSVDDRIQLLEDSGVPEDRAELYSEAVRRGAAAVCVETSDEDADKAAGLLDRHGAADLDELVESWRRSGFVRHDRAAAPLPREQLAADQAGRERAIPVIREELKVGKRTVTTGGVRVFTRVKEKAVEAQVPLREERVTVDRRKVDQPISGRAFDAAAREGVVAEVRATSEEPVVQKQARVVEEVVVGTQAREHTETVRDKVRGTEVEVERIEGEPPRGAPRK